MPLAEEAEPDMLLLFLPASQWVLSQWRLSLLVHIHRMVQPTLDPQPVLYMMRAGGVTGRDLQ